MRILVSPELGRIAMQQGLEVAFIAWSILRGYGVATKHSGHYTKKEAARIAALHGLKFSQRHWTRIWEQGEYYFWGIERNRLHLRSFAKTTERLGKLAKHEEITRQAQVFFVEIQLSEGIESLRSELYFAWFAQFDERTISRDTLRDLFGLSHDQQRAYEDKLGARILVKSNYAHIDGEMYQDNPRELPEHHFTIKYEREVALNQDIDADAGFGVRQVTAYQYQLPNTFMARHSDSGASPVPFAPNRARNAIKYLDRHTDNLSPIKRTYWLSWRKFERMGSLDDYVRAASQGKKRLFLTGHYF